MFMLADVLCGKCAHRWRAAIEEEPGDPVRMTGFECPNCCAPTSGRIDSRRLGPFRSVADVQATSDGTRWLDDPGRSSA